MQLLLGELPIKSGSVAIHGSVSYASQKPWLFTGTVRSNILFGETYDRKRYKEVKINHSVKTKNISIKKLFESILC